MCGTTGGRLCERELTNPDELHAEGTFQSVIDTNLKSVWVCMKYEIPQMLEQGSGAIVNTSSIAGLVGVPQQPNLRGQQARGLRIVQVGRPRVPDGGVRINAVCPGLIDTPLMDRIYASNPELKTEADNWHPMERTGKLEEVAEAVIWLCSNKASFVVGHMMTVDRGLVARG